MIMAKKNINKNTVAVGANKKYKTLEEYIKSKKRVDLGKLISDATFNTLLSKDTKAYNERIRYNKNKGDTVPANLKVSDIKKDIKSGKMTTQGFKSVVKSLSSYGYNRPKKERPIDITTGAKFNGGSDIVKTPPTPTVPKEPRGIDTGKDAFKRLERAFINKYGKDYYDKHRDVVMELKDNIQELKRKGLKDTSQNFYKVVNSFDKSLSEIERHNKLLRNYIQTGDFKEALIQTQREEVMNVNAMKEQKLREQLKEYFKNDPVRLSAVDNMTYDEMRTINDNEIKLLYQRDKEKWYSPQYFAKAEELPDMVLNEKVVRRLIGGGSLKTSLYIDNFIKRLREQQKEGFFTKEVVDKVLEMINFIPFEMLGDVLTDKRIELHDWYRSDDVIEKLMETQSHNATVESDNFLKDFRETMIYYYRNNDYFKYWKDVDSDSRHKLEVLLGIN